jgi:hypothetical protein
MIDRKNMVLKSLKNCKPTFVEANVQLNSLTAISPIDGRYSDQTKAHARCVVSMVYFILEF